MTEEQAEEIWMANQVGLFKGTGAELAQAVLILKARENKPEEIKQSMVSQPTLDAIKHLLDTLVDEQRVELFNSYCIYCGRKEKDKPCHCMNDE